MPESKKEEEVKPLIYLVSILAAIGGILFGYDTGIVSGAMIFIRDEFELNSLWQELIVSATIAAAWIFSVVSGQVTDGWGRKPTILFSSLIFAIGSLIMAASWNKYVLIIGRFIVGAAIGFSSTTIPVYIAEVAPIQIRGKLVTVFQLFITLGLLLSSIIAGSLSYYPHYGWRYDFLSLIIFFISCNPTIPDTCSASLLFLLSFNSLHSGLCLNQYVFHCINMFISL
jgi:MFS transporter, SP family, solute carrier family 2 (myo-inositol transporter), member 13